MKAYLTLSFLVSIAISSLGSYPKSLKVKRETLPTPETNISVMNFQYSESGNTSRSLSGYEFESKLEDLYGNVISLIDGETINVPMIEQAVLQQYNKLLRLSKQIESEYVTAKVLEQHNSVQRVFELIWDLIQGQPYVSSDEFSISNLLYHMIELQLKVFALMDSEGILKAGIENIQSKAIALYCQFSYLFNNLESRKNARMTVSLNLAVQTAEAGRLIRTLKNQAVLSWLTQEYCITNYTSILPRSLVE